MQTTNEIIGSHQPKSPWNKGKLLGSKPPLQTKQVWAIRSKLQVAHRPRDLALFNLAIDSKLRGCDLVNLKSRGHCSARFHSRAGMCAPAENRTSGKVRAIRANAGGY